MNLQVVQFQSLVVFRLSVKNPMKPRVHLGATTFPSRIQVIGTLPRSSRVLSDGTHPASRKYLFSTHDHGWLRSSRQGRTIYLALRRPDCTLSRLFALVAEEDDRLVTQSIGTPEPGCPDPHPRSSRSLLRP